MCRVGEKDSRKAWLGLGGSHFPNMYIYINENDFSLSKLNILIYLYVNTLIRTYHSSLHLLFRQQTTSYTIRGVCDNDFQKAQRHLGVNIIAILNANFIKSTYYNILHSLLSSISKSILSKADSNNRS